MKIKLTDQQAIFLKQLLTVAREEIIQDIKELNTDISERDYVENTQIVNKIDSILNKL
jgi:hypothetical protein